MKKKIIGLGVIAIIIVNIFVGINYAKGSIDLKFLDEIALASGIEWPNCTYDLDEDFSQDYWTYFANSGRQIGEGITYYEYYKVSNPTQRVFAINLTGAITAFNGDQMRIVNPVSTMSVPIKTCDANSSTCCTEIQYQLDYWYDF